ncbi:DUF4336 domain-containing protein [Geitlerinema calcuttense]|uniref:DUF4336 domain-containing protein n=1 Tax=Geitlerinema calcuttense NRMC-F 0142 TaxID=2922238 RepID=A0ABT7LVX0_9CYAN|nr:DUF4336 domain-containing protein [Geitlerinema calcuttense]MDL5056188.1 DUF4336 domain-containing protein [Geitlerinema calcuttense NRMC-F 0142]
MGEKHQHSIMQGQTDTRYQDWAWPLWPIVPLYPYGRRRTLRQEVVKDKIWTFEQSQGILYVVVPIRMSAIALESGGLLIYAPVAPTPECIRLVRELEAQHGEVQAIVLPTISGIEHKVFVGPFARHFPQAQVYVAPHQWSFPVNLPLSWLGFPRKRTHILPADSRQNPLGDEFDYAILGPIELGPGRFAEVALFHKRSRTLFVTDSVLAIPPEPPEIIQLEPYPLLFHAKDDALHKVLDSPENRRKGWQRISLFAFYFSPSTLNVANLFQSIRDAFAAPDRSKQAYFGWFPFQWQDNWQQSFHALSRQGRLFVAPILQTLILNRAPQATLDWVNRVQQWNFQQIIPCHMQAVIQADGEQFRQAFAFLEKPQSTLEGNRLPEADFQLLQTLNRALTQTRIVPPAKLD